MIRPGPAFAHLAAEPVRACAWLLLRGPLFVALAFACSISVLTRGYLAPGLVASEVIAWSFVPLAGMGGLAVVWRARRRDVSFAQASDLFFAGHAPWLLWLVASAVFWASVRPPPPAVFSIWAASMTLVAAWSAWIDLHFFRHIFGMKAPGRYLLVQRTIAWALFVAVFGGVSSWPGLLEELGR